VAALADRACIPCKGAVQQLDAARAQELLQQLANEWQLRETGHLFLEKTYKFKDFVEALAFVNRVGALAEEQAHHPDLHLAWGRVTVSVWTHKIKGLTESDFIFAAKCERLARGGGISS
jgi:4a-hydroxytetrahydrobiopterin dehydratase